MRTRFNGVTLSDYIDLEVRESGLAVPEVEPAYKAAIYNGVGLDDNIVYPQTRLFLPFFLLKGPSFKSVDAYKHTATVYGPTWHPQGRVYDGVDDYISVPNSSNLTATSQDFTLLAWFKPAATGEQHDLFNKGLENTDGWDAYITAAKHFRVDTWQSGAQQTTRSNASVSAGGVFYHFAVSRSGATITIYQDATDVSDVQGAHINPATNTRAVIIGNYGAEYARGTYGAMTFIIGKALSAAEITAHYNATKWRYQ